MYPSQYTQHHLNFTSYLAHLEGSKLSKYHDKLLSRANVSLQYKNDVQVSSSRVLPGFTLHRKWDGDE